MRRSVPVLALMTFATLCFAAGHGGGGGGAHGGGGGGFRGGGGGGGFAGGGFRGGGGFGGGGFRAGGIGFGGYGRGFYGYGGFGFGYPFGGYYGFYPGYAYGPGAYGYASCDPYYGYSYGCGYAPAQYVSYAAPYPDTGGYGAVAAAYSGYGTHAQTVYPASVYGASESGNARYAAPAPDTTRPATTSSRPALTSVAYRTPAQYTVYPGPAADGAEVPAGDAHRFLNDGRWHRFGER